MRYRCSSHCQSRPLMLTLAVVAMFVASAMTASAQSLDPTTFRPNTPQAVSNGTATLVGHYNPNQTLRLTLVLQPPHWAEEQAFLQQLQTKGSAQFLQYLSDEEWNQRFSPSAA